jgi:hypothetical protein
LQRYWTIRHHGKIKAYSEDLRKRIVEAIGKCMGKSEAAQNFKTFLL